MRRKTYLFSLLTLCALLMSLPAQAQKPAQNNNFDQFNYGFGQQPEQPEAEKPKAFNPYDKKYRPRPITTNDTRELVGERDLVPTIIRLPGTRPSDLTLRLVAGKAVTGCLKKDAQSVTITKENGAMKIKLSGGKIAPNQNTVRYALYQCNIKTGISTADITLNRDDLIAESIKTITIQSENTSTLAKLKIDIFPEKITFTEDAGLSKPTKKSTMPGQAYDQTFWFYPEGTRILRANTSDKSENIENMVRTLARSKGLTPLEEIFPDFRTPLHGSGKIYVVDDKSLYKNENNEPAILGEIDLPEMFLGPEGQQERLVKKKVYIQTPGLYD